MEGAPLSLILDAVILVLLGLTIVYAARLSLQLKRLRDSKSELDKIVRDLIKNIDRADRAINGLKEAARDSGMELQEAIHKATGITDELEVIVDSGDRLANRLEGLVEQGRPLTSGTAPRPQTPPQPQPKQAEAAKTAPAQDTNYAQHLRKLDAAEEKAARVSFAIRDPDAERGIDPTIPADDETLYSEAERDLFRAMKGKAGTR